jgi:uncharacterized membrane protein YoaK (UPF0700 family)
MAIDASMDRGHVRAVRTDAGSMQLRLMLALTFSTGIVDAVGFLGLDRVFTANMTGNVVILGMALVGADGLPVMGPLLALLGFMAGAALSGRALRRSSDGWGSRVTAVLTGVGALCMGLGVALLVDVDVELTWVITALLGLAMGMQAAAARFLAVKDVTTVVITSTITGLAADSMLGSGRGGSGARRVWAVLLMLAGAAVGAALVQWHVAAGVLLTGLLVLVVALVGHLHARVRFP